MNDDVKKLGEPLTLEQLRGMDGEPVWVEFEDGSGGLWGIVHIAVFDQIVFSNGLHCTIGKPYYGKTYKAYLHQPVIIDLDAWTTHWVERERHAGGFHEETGRIVPAPGMLSEEKATVLVDGRHTYKGLYCAKCGAAAADTFLDICPRCGRAATKEGLDILEKRLRGCNHDT